MFPSSKANVGKDAHSGVIHYHLGTKMVPAPKAGRRVMSVMTGLDTHSTDLRTSLQMAGEILRIEAEALIQIADRLDAQVIQAAHLIANHEGLLHITGVGKAGLVGQKFAATAASFGIRSFFLHPVEAVHGDLGRVGKNDILFALSQSGESEEVLNVCSAAHEMGIPVIALTSSVANPLGRTSDLTVPLGEIQEACPMGLAPTTSTTAMMALCDVIAILVARFKGILPENFAANHPAGKLGRKLRGVDQIMRSGRHIRIACESEIVRDVLVRLGGARRRSGAILVLEQVDGPLSGIFTDSDLVRLLERGSDHMLDLPIRESMTRNPSIIHIRSTVAEAVEALRSRKLSELPVVDDSGYPCGLIDVTDLIGLVSSDLDEEV
jgi:arabinose-5-phosphate isomerase